MSVKGFTLIELLAVIVILAIIALIATPIVLNIIEDSKKSSKLNSANHYMDAVEQAIMKEKMSSGNFIPSECDIQLDGNLLCDGAHKVEVKVDGETPVSGKIKFMSGNIESVDLEFSNKSYFVLDYNGNLIPGEKQPEKTDKQICTLVSDADNSNSVTPGDEYLCKVKDEMEEDFTNGYTFYVLSPNSDGTTNLILDRNIYYDVDNDTGKVTNSANLGYVPWYENTNDNSYGPVTAMTYLNNATKDWDNVSNINISFEDQIGNSIGYGEIKTANEETTTITKKDGTVTATFENLKARLPMQNELIEYGNCKKALYVSTVSCSSWLTKYLNKDLNGTGEVLNIYAYWILDSNAVYAAYDVYSGGNIGHNATTSKNRGVRPVITLTLN